MSARYFLTNPLTVGPHICSCSLTITPVLYGAPVLSLNDKIGYPEVFMLKGLVYGGHTPVNNSMFSAVCIWGQRQMPDMTKKNKI